MKPQWENLLKAINEHADDLEVFINNVSDSVAHKNLKILARGYNAVLAKAEEFGKLVEPIAPRQIEMPFKTEQFVEAWTDYKEYLIEDHNMYFNSRREQYMLKKLKRWSKNNEARAIEILEFYIVNGYRAFFPPAEKQLTGEEVPAAENRSDNIDLVVDKNERV